MRAKEQVLRACSASVTLLLILACCAHAAMRGGQPDVRRVVHNGQEVEVDVAIADVLPLLEEFSGRGMHISAIWNVPGLPAMRLAIVEKAATETGYGPQLIAIRVGGGAQVLHESPRLYDDDFVRPTFFKFPGRTLLLADHGSEDAYGVLAWSIENGGVRDLGQLQIALPEDKDVFTRGAAATARVELRNGKYVITIPGPVLLDPQGEEERLLAKQGEVVTFKEADGRFEIAQR